MVEWIKSYFAKNGDAETKALIGISGGKDSSVVAAACVKALGKERVIGVMMPNGEQKDIEDSKRLIKHLGIQSYEVNIGDAYNALSNTILDTVDNQLTNQFKTNTPSRLRMVTLYAIAAQIGNCRISCNGNKDEAALGYFTLWGDGAGDFAPLINMHVSEVRKAGIELGLPEELVMKAPSDGMCGKTDEEQLGVTYDAVERHLKLIEHDSKVSGIVDSMSWKRRLLNIPSFKPKENPVKALVIVDAQKDFIDGTMGVGLDKWSKAKTKILELIREGGYANILFTADWHPHNHCSFKEQGGRWPRHCVKYTEGAVLDEELYSEAQLHADEGVYCFEKGCDYRDEEYASHSLCEWLRMRSLVLEIDVVGLVREYCVEETRKMIENVVQPFTGAHVRIVEEGTVKLGD